MELLFGSGIAHAIFVLACVISCGLLLGQLKIAGVSFGMAWILFAGIVFGHFGLRVDDHTLHFVREFGLVMFVFSIGLQVGPGFLTAMKKGGLKLNGLAVGVVLLGVACTIALHFITGISAPTMVGIMSGAVTNTPGLGAAQQANLAITGKSDPTIASGYALAYPLAVVGIIVSMILVRILARVDLKQEEEQLAKQASEQQESAQRFAVRVTNPEIAGKTFKQLSKIIPHKFVASRIKHPEDTAIELVDGETVIHQDDVLVIVAERKDHEFLRTFFGPVVDLQPQKWEGPDAVYEPRRVLLSRPSLNGVSIQALSLRKNHGINVTRVNRAGVDLVARPDLRLQLGDRLTIVGTDQALKNAEGLMGNSERRLDTPNLIVIFVGIVIGVLVGSIPLRIAGMPHPVSLGLAGGPLIVAILLGRFGYRLRLVTYSTMSANLMLREVGMALFLAGVGLSAGSTFVSTVINGGYMWILWGLIITVLPVITIGLIAKLGLKLNYFVTIGMLAGATTDPPALSFSQTLSDSDASSVSYAAVYPVTMFLRVLAGQVLIIALC